jgi:hypothetical protein
MSNYGSRRTASLFDDNIDDCSDFSGEVPSPPPPNWTRLLPLTRCGVHYARSTPNDQRHHSVCDSAVVLRVSVLAIHTDASSRTGPTASLFDDNIDDCSDFSGEVPSPPPPNWTAEFIEDSDAEAGS